MSSSGPGDLAAYEEQLRAVTVGEPAPLAGPIEIRGYDPDWPRWYERAAARIRSALGSRVARLEHAGSTSVPGLPAKPIIDIVLEVPDSSDEPGYVPVLEAAGFELRIREPEWFEHRTFRGADPVSNLHVFTANCDEVDRMLLFRDRLRSSATDRERYAKAKRELAARDWTYMQQYADAKTDVIRDIMARAEAAGTRRATDAGA
jgi:GrpB-like predicted nucleotidyltransferase (UPF0157 family)